MGDGRWGVFREPLLPNCLSARLSPSVIADLRAWRAVVRGGGIHLGVVAAVRVLFQLLLRKVNVCDVARRTEKRQHSQ